MIINLKKLRKKYNLTMEQLAINLGMCKSAICRIEKNTSNVSIETLIKIAKFFNVSTDYLLGLKETEN